MVLVILGTQLQSFARIIDYVVNSKELEKENIVIQAGNTKYEKKYDKDRIKIIDFLSQDEFEKNIQEADFVIMQGGVGGIFTSLVAKKKVLAVPRLKKFNEHVNNHQLEICRELEKEGYIMYLNENECNIVKFNEKIKELKNSNFKEYVSDNRYLEILEKEI